MPNLYIVFFDKAAAEILSNTWEKYLGYTVHHKSYLPLDDQTDMNSFFLIYCSMIFRFNMTTC